MKSSEHTPGPWTAEKLGYDGFRITYHEDGIKRYLCHGYDEKNASLIAAAPDLLAALKLIDSNAGESVEWIRRHTREAIRKARGE
jgi:hypothetical protein